MNRSTFLTTVGLGLSATAVGGNIPGKRRAKSIPPYLKAGDTIGITCPSGPACPEELQPAVLLLQEWGFQVRLGLTVGLKHFTMGGTVEQRREDMQQMLDNPDIKAILCARGGYGAVQIIDQLDFRNFQKHPKWLLGFSDITAFHCHLSRQLGVASIHSKMTNSFPESWELADELQKATLLSIRQALTGAPAMHYTAPAVAFNRAGTGSGKLTGGNLRLIETLAGSRSDIDTRHKILFVEDTREPLYNVDRMFYNLKRSGKLDRLAGLIIGGFNISERPDSEPFGRSVYEIVSDLVRDLPYPVCFDFPVGHQVNNFALKCGVPHHLEVTATGATLTEC